MSGRLATSSLVVLGALCGCDGASAGEADVKVPTVDGDWVAAMINDGVDVSSTLSGSAGCNTYTVEGDGLDLLAADGTFVAMFGRQ